MPYIEELLLYYPSILQKSKNNAKVFTFNLQLIVLQIALLQIVLINVHVR